MTLTDIKNRLEAELKKRTIDDLYAQSPLNMAIELFSDSLNWKTDMDIKNYLTEKFEETSLEVIELSFENFIFNKNFELELIAKKTSNLNDKNVLQEKEIVEKREKLDKINSDTIEVKKELEEIEIEINQLTTLTLLSKENNSIRISELKTRIEEKNTLLSNFTTLSSEIINEMREIEKAVRENNKLIREGNSEVKIINLAIKDEERKVKQLRKYDESFYKNEWDSLVFVFKIFYFETIYIEKIFGIRNKNTGLIIEEDEWRGISKEEKVHFERKIIEYLLENSETDQRQVYNLLEGYTSSNNLIPKDWRKILFETFSKRIPKISGYVHCPEFRMLPYASRNSEDHYFDNITKHLSAEDTSSILALKMASRYNPSVKTEDNEIVLALSGGIAAKIVFRKKGEVIKKLHSKPFEIYINYSKLVSNNKYIESELKNKTLYYQDGYANSTVDIRTPGAYYILNDEHVIEINFEPAPILFDMNTLSRMVPNVSGKKKLDDEAEEREAAERARKEFDEWWDDYDDDY